jgi:hypothetical protein
MKRAMILAAMAALPVAPLPAAAQESAASKHNVECFLVVGALSENKDPKARTFGAMASNFFAGQIFGADPKIDLTAAMRREAKQMNEARFKTLLKQCTDEMKARHDQVTAAGKALSAEAAAAAPKTAPSAATPKGAPKAAPTGR